MAILAASSVHIHLLVLLACAGAVVAGVVLVAAQRSGRRTQLWAVMRGPVVWRRPTPREIPPVTFLQPAFLRVYGMYQETYPLWVDVQVRPGVDPADVVTPEGGLDMNRITRVSTWFMPPQGAQTFDVHRRLVAQQSGGVR
jgi:hypothetical protein